MAQLSQQDKLNDFAMFMSYKPTWLFYKFFSLPPYFNKIALFSGNQGGKTTIASYEKVMRSIGSHPVPEKNVLFFECENGHTYGRPAPWPGLHHFGLNDGECFWMPDKAKAPQKIIFPMDMRCQCGAKLSIRQRGTTTYRLCSENLPMDKEGGGADSSEIKNRTYPELKKWLPPFLIKKEISIRSPALRIMDINSGCVFGTGKDAVQYQGKDIIFEFLSYSQDVQAGAGTQRMGIYADEEPPFPFYEEQLPRLLAEDGDFMIGLTPANRSSWTFNDFFEEAEVFIRTDAICNFYRESGEKKDVKRIERTPIKSRIAVFQSATDDNPTLKAESIDRLISYTDPDTMATRRYGIHRQATGRIFKDFDRKIHLINPEEFFPSGNVPHFWTHFRGIDYHPKTPWACGACTLSPTNEVFIWMSADINPERKTHFQIMEQFAHSCMDYRFKLQLVDPLSEGTKVNMISVLDDIRRISSELKREGIGTGGYWEPWNTKGEHGRNAIKERLKNSRRVGRPFNNKIVEEGKTYNLPTIWIFNTQAAALAGEYMAKWSWEQWADASSQTTKDDKNTPQQKWSHMNCVWEAILKHTGFTFTRNAHPVERNMSGQHFNAGRR